MDWISGPGGGVERIRLNRQTPAHLVRHGILGIQSRDHPDSDPVDAKARRVHQGEDTSVLVEDRGWDWLRPSGMRRPSSPGCA